MTATIKQAISPGATSEELNDPFVTWLRFANAGMLNGCNLPSFNYAISNLPSQSPIVEIGSFCGLSTNLLAYYKRKHNRTNQVFNCDKWMFEGANLDGRIGITPITHREYREFVKDTYIRNTRMFSRDDLPHTIELFSDDFFTAWRAGREMTDVYQRPAKLGGPISFCYVDGNHSYEFAKKDFQNCDEFLEPGGFILFDDSGDDSAWEVVKVVAEVKKTGRYEVIANNPNYLFRKL